MNIHTSRLALAAILGAAMATTASAQDLPDFGLNASYARIQDNNLYRQGSNAVSEQYGVATLGLRIHTQQGLQHLELDASVADYAYSNATNLNTTVSNYQGLWRWALTPRVGGDFGVERRETPNTFADGQASNLRNQQLATSEHLDAAFEVEGPWHLLAGVAHARQQALAASDDFNSEAVNAGLRYDWASGSQLGWRITGTDGSYLGRNLNQYAAQFQDPRLDDRFRQIDMDVTLHWLLGEGSTAEAKIAHSRTTHPTYSERDFSGLTGSASLAWALSGKSALQMAYARERGAYATDYSSYSETERVSLGPVWQVSNATQIGLRHAWSQIDFAGFALKPLAQARRDTQNDTTLFVHWQPSRVWTLIASLQRLTRSSSFPGLDYAADVASLSAQLSF
jgi:exopolysaccharide biosynthesis operon protein EpsL